MIGWYGGSLVSRLNNKQTGSIVVVMQRLHENDLAGHLLEQGGWCHLDLPAIAIEDAAIQIGDRRWVNRKIGEVLHEARESRADLEGIKAEMGSLMFSAQYQQRPVPLEGNLIKRDWFRYYNSLPTAGQGSLVVQSWDVATMIGPANDYSVCTTWLVVKSDYYLVDVCPVRLQYPDLRRKVASLAARHSAAMILIEDAGPGMQLLQDLRRDVPSGMVRPLVFGLREAKQIVWQRNLQRSKRAKCTCQNAQMAGHLLIEMLGFQPRGMMIRLTASRSS